ncbi:hypothetical protein IRJ41_014600 [Triplophysa rosa]|uniref:Uncharacterized protein n=1 Tax=Triplophysa rosa TaxID=992332 RepID=A0A9W7TRH2_TRIRA|nr:hypothetical protein IRJ41_014600 [Triplophysa rosa]
MKTDYKHLPCTKRKLRNKEKDRDHDRGDNTRIKRARETGQEDTDRPEGADTQEWIFIHLDKLYHWEVSS